MKNNLRNMVYYFISPAKSVDSPQNRSERSRKKVIVTKRHYTYFNMTIIGCPWYATAIGVRYPKDAGVWFNARLSWVAGGLV
jgi:hypothetical protein